MVRKNFSEQNIELFTLEATEYAANVTAAMSRNIILIVYFHV